MLLSQQWGNRNHCEGALFNDPLLGADGEAYAVAQGNLLVGGLGVEGADGSSLIVNIPTVGRIPGGGTVERLIETGFLETDNLILNLHQGDFSITNQVAEAINNVFGNGGCAIGCKISEGARSCSTLAEGILHFHARKY